MRKIFSPETWRLLRPDLARALLLAVVVALLWCAWYDRWTENSWQAPVEYLSSPEKADVISVLATVRAARDGRFSPFQFTNIPELGAPFVANWDDYPTTEKPLFGFMGFLAGFIGLFAAANFAVMLGQVLAAISFYAACRLLNYAWPWSCAGALVFAFSTYAFAHGLHHIAVLYFWHVPLCLVICLWIFRGEKLEWGGWHLGFALAVAFVTGVQNVYYTWMFAQLVLLGGLFQVWQRGWKALLVPLGIIAVAAGAFLLMNLNSICYQLVNGGNHEAVVRDYKWLEIYGLKLVDMVVPPPGHPFPPFADWAQAHLKEILLAPGERPPSAYLGLVGLAALAWLVAVSLRQAVERKGLPLEAWLILWILLYAGVGGFNGILGALGFTMFRAATRYSIFILCLVLLAAIGRLSQLKPRRRGLAYGMAILIVAVALWDQTPPMVSGQALAKTEQAVAWDRQFTQGMEQALPARAMVFQIPIMEFPESLNNRLAPYSHLRPYLYSEGLRFSFGSDKGRAQSAWQAELDGLSANDVVRRLEDYGFSAIYVNRKAFPDGQDIVKVLEQAGCEKIVESPQGDLVCLRLKSAARPILPSLPRSGF